MKRKLVKMLTVACVTAIAASTFVGCGSKDEAPKDNEKPSTEQSDGSGEKKVLEIAVFEGGFGKDYWEACIDAFEAANPDVEVKMEANPKIGDIIRPKLSSENTPDFIYLSSNDPSGIANALVKDKALVDLTDVFDREDPDNPGQKLKDKILPGFLDTPLTTPYGDGKVFLAPLYYNVTGMWYNKALLKEKGWEVPKTWDEFFALGEKAKAEGIALYTYQGQAPGYNEAIVFPMLASAAGEEAVEKIFNYEEGAWKDANVKKALDVFQKMADEDMVLNGTVGMSHTQAQVEFLNGKALFLPCGSWLEGEMKDAIPEGFEFGFMAPPSFKEGDTPYVTTTIEQMYIPAKSDQIDLAKDFLAFQYTDAMVQKNAEIAKAVVPVKGAVEKAKGSLDASGYESYKVVEEGAKPIPLSFKPTNSKIDFRQDSVFAPIGSIINKELTVDEWIENLEADSQTMAKQIVE
ncbi:carbohydrate ABC transporter substrate-binding protein [Clostridium perfringens]|nr:carbohydrate ABC transporter substrate-binding protein [Clostridium perfringens]